MRFKLRPSRLAWMLTLLVTARTADAGFVTVDATSNLFAAGLGSTSTVGGGSLPIAIDLAPGVGRSITFDAVTGIVAPDFSVSNGPDGGTYRATNINAAGFVSGLRAGRALFLAGVFLAPTNQATPPTLDFTNNTSFTTLSPLLQQSFFIGDGLTGTGSGSVQTFFVPDGATRLYLGFADAGFFTGDPGGYTDNTGRLSVTFNGSAVPEPGSLTLTALGLVAVAARAHSKRPNSGHGPRAL